MYHYNMSYIYYYVYYTLQVNKYRVTQIDWFGYFNGSFCLNMLKMLKRGQGSIFSKIP